MPTVLTDQEVLDLVRQRFPGDEARILAAIGPQAAILRAQLADNGGGIIGVTPPAGYTSETLNALLAEIDTLEPPRDLAEAVEGLVNSTLRLADVSQPRPPRPAVKRARRR